MLADIDGGTILGIIIGLTDDSEETPPDAIETALIAETAAQQAPSATAWNSVPLYFHAHTLQRLSELLSNIDVVFALSDEGHRAALAAASSSAGEDEGACTIM